MTRIQRWLAAAITGTLAAVALVALPLPQNAAPASAIPAVATWDPGFIISDVVFYDGKSMDTAGVQKFLNTKLAEQGGCQEHHTAAPDQPQPPYVCLANYKQKVPTMPADEYCSKLTGGKGVSAAKLIVLVARACSINPKALIVLLQKEQSLVTDVWPWPRQYSAATGFGCPDTAPCDPDVAGFFYQVYYAARQFQKYRVATPATSGFNFFAGQTVNIQFNPNPSCGAAPVTIRNAATAGLYNYTPYQPNQSALNNLYGSGDGCGAYGNRNFWRLWWDWFGDPRGGDPSFVSALFQDMLGYQPDVDSLRAWSWKLVEGESPVDLANDILFGKDYRRIRVTEAYQNVLGREPGRKEAGFAYWVKETAWDGLPIDEVQHYFLASKENFKRLGNDPKKFVNAMYAQLLGREATMEDRMYWSKITKKDGSGAIDVIWAMYRSPESGKFRVRAMYQALLDRKPSSKDLKYWGPQVIEHGDNVIRAFLVGSDEYRKRAAQRFPAV